LSGSSLLRRHSSTTAGRTRTVSDRLDSCLRTTSPKSMAATADITSSGNAQSRSIIEKTITIRVGCQPTKTPDMGRSVFQPRNGGGDSCRRKMVKSDTIGDRSRLLQ
jgi:hypothetical protein